MRQTTQPREYTRTEFVFAASMVGLWAADHFFGVDPGKLLQHVDMQTITDAKASVLELAVQLKQATGSDSNWLLLFAAIVYGLKKVEKIAAILKVVSADKKGE